jgi:hypothetical protein
MKIDVVQAFIAWNEDEVERYTRDYERGKTFMEDLMWEMQHQQLYIHDTFFQHGFQDNRIFFSKEALHYLHQALLIAFLQTNHSYFLGLAQYLELKSHNKGYIEQLLSEKSDDADPEESKHQKRKRLRNTRRPMFR